MAVAPDGQLLVALRDGTVRRSSDGGASWASAPGLGFVSALAFGPAAPASTVFAVVSHPPAPVEDGRRLADEGDGVFRLEGARWRRVLSGVVWQVVPHPADPSRVYATGPDAVYRSVDGGATFERVAAQVLYWVVVDGTRPDRLLGVDNDETLVRSDDAGSTWTHAAAPFEDAQGLSQPVAGAPHRVLVALDDNDEDDPSVVASDDFGATWRGLPPTGRTSFVLLTVSPADPDRIYGRTVNSTGAEAIATSADVGTSWSAHGLPLDGLGPRVSLTAPTISLLRTAGGVERPRARIPLRLPPEERALVEGEVRLVARLGGRDATIGSGEFESDGHHTFTASVRIGPRTAARLRAAGQVRGLLRIRATDDVGENARSLGAVDDRRPSGGRGQLTARRQERLERVAARRCSTRRRRLVRRRRPCCDRGDQVVAELGPRRARALQHADAHAERATLPGLLEDELAVRRAGSGAGRPARRRPRASVVAAHGRRRQRRRRADHRSRA